MSLLWSIVGTNDVISFQKDLGKVYSHFWSQIGACRSWRMEGVAAGLGSRAPQPFWRAISAPTRTLVPLHGYWLVCLNVFISIYMLSGLCTGCSTVDVHMWLLLVTSHNKYHRDCHYLQQQGNLLPVLPAPPVLCPLQLTVWSLCTFSQFSSCWALLLFCCFIAVSAGQGLPEKPFVLFCM